MKKTSLKIYLLILSVMLLMVTHAHAEESLCARVKIEIHQELTLERQAFEAHMKINNGFLDLPIQNLGVAVMFTDEQGSPVKATSDPNDLEALFFIRVDRLENIDHIDGTGTLSPGAAADLYWLIIPAKGAAGGAVDGTLYFVGANLSYQMSGQNYNISVSPDYIFVKPLPELTLDYFLPEYVYGDDAFTDAIEPSVPFTLGVRVRNDGMGNACNLKIKSAQPQIVENEQSLIIGFYIEESEVNGQPATPSLLVDFGDIASGKACTARWIMHCSLSGQFVEFSADYTHSDELGGELTSLISGVNTHTSIHDVLVDLPGRDSIRDFLVKTETGYTMFESDRVDTPVKDQSALSSIQYDATYDHENWHILIVPVTAGFLYAKLEDPYAGTMDILEATRSDGKQIARENIWLSKERDEENNWLYFVNFFDVNTVSTYRVIFAEPASVPGRPVLQYIPDLTGTTGEELSFIIKASDPDGTIPKLTARPLPKLVHFIDRGDGIGIFEWTPDQTQTGKYQITFTASDGILADTQSVSIVIGSMNTEDTDGDGLPDSWEIEFFGTLDRDGSEDFDGDGYSDLEEFEACSHPDSTTDYPKETIVQMEEGFNLVAIPAGTACKANLGDWIDVFNAAGTIEKVKAYDDRTGSFVTLKPGETIPEFARKGGEGLIVYTTGTTEVIFTAVSCMSIDLERGINLVGFACPPEGYTASRLLNELGTEAISSVQRYNAEKGAFETIGFDESGQTAGIDFPVVAGEGYFLNMKMEIMGFMPE